MFKKKKTVNLTFYTKQTQQLVDMFSPTLTGKLVPDWFKDLKPAKDPLKPNMNSCPGLVDFFKNSVSIPLWMDHRITYRGNQILNVDLPGVRPEHTISFVQQHHPEQYNNAFNKSCHIKLMSPWLVTADRNMDFLMHDATWHKHKQMGEFSIVPGVLNFKYQSSSAVNMFLSPCIEEKELFLEAGSVIAYLTPLEDVKLNIETKLVSDEQWSQLLKHQFTFTNMYKKTKKFIDKANKL